jgi:hypothetical protein
MSFIVLLIVLSAVSYRVSRFLLLDSLIDETRNSVLEWLEMHPNRFTLKLLELLGCPYCVTIWVSAATVGVTALFVEDPIPMPVWTWLATATGSLVFWRWIDSE